MNDVNKNINNVTYDDSLPLLLEVVERILGDATPDILTVVRDIFGRLSVVAPDLSRGARTTLGAELSTTLNNYTVKSGNIIDASSTMGRQLLRIPGLLRVETLPSGRDITVKTIDRRVVGQDWVLAPRCRTSPQKRYVFASLKGGVGRSTALAVAAAHFAKSGMDVLVIDLDLEAPGLGSMLLGPQQRPRFGAIDYLVENGRCGIADHDLVNFIGTSELTDRETGQGIVDVVPAAGSACLQHPHNVLGKLARALIEDPTDSGDSVGVRDQISEMVDRLASQRNYDVILIDARAGLAELAAGAILGMDATILLFGVDQPQTFEGYAYLLSHLSQLAPNDGGEWRYNVRFVHSKAPASPKERERFRDTLYEVFVEHFYETYEDEPIDGEAVFNFSLDEAGAPHDALWIGFDGGYLNFDPVLDRKYLETSVYKAAFGDFLEALSADLAKGGSAA